MELNNNYLQFLKTYINNPNCSNNHLANILEVSQITIKNYYKTLKNEQLLFPDTFFQDKNKGMRIKGDTVIIPNYKKLGLINFILRISNVKSEEILQIVKKFIETLPYLQYNFIYYIPNRSLLTTFTIPKKLLNEFIQIKNKIEILFIAEKIDFLISESQTISKIDLRHYDISKREFFPYFFDDENDYKDTLNKLFAEFYLKVKDIDKDDYEIEGLDELDFNLLHELEINAKIPLKTLGEYYDKDVSTLSRRIKSLKENLIDDYKIFLNNNSFNLRPYAISGGGKNRTIITLRKLISSGVIGLESRLFYNKNYFIWILYANPKSIEQISEFASPFCSNFNIHPLLFENNYFLFDPKLYDFKNKKWSDFSSNQIQNTIDQIQELNFSYNEVPRSFNFDYILSSGYNINIDYINEKLLDLYDFLEEINLSPPDKYDLDTIKFKLKIKDIYDKQTIIALLGILAKDNNSPELKYLMEMISAIQI